MTDLPVSGPPQLDLRWSQTVDERPDGRRQRELFPRAHHQELEGYLHPGVAAAAILGAAEQAVGGPRPVGSLAVAFEAPVPLGMDLSAVVDRGDGTRAVELQVLDRPDREEEPVRTLLRGTVAGPERVEVPDAGALRTAAIAPVPEPTAGDLHAACFVCGPANPRGLELRPGRQAPDTVLTAFQPSEQMAVGGVVPAPMVAALLPCPTLWACSPQLDELGAPAALLATLEVQFLDDPSPRQPLRLVGLAGERRERTLHGRSALVSEDGDLHAVATASWVAVDEVPAREAGRPAPASATEPRKGGRPEARSDADWGQPLPGRRQTAGPRSERPGDHDDRDAMDVPVERPDPAAPRRTLTDDEG